MMKRHYFTKEPLVMIAEPDPEPMEHSEITSDSDTDTAEEDVGGPPEGWLILHQLPRLI